MPIGPVQVVVIGFADPNFDGQALKELERLRDSDVVRMIDLLDLHVLRRTDGGDLVQASTAWYLIVAAIAAIVSVALLHLLLATTPQPFTFFGWIGGLAVAAATLLPLGFDASRNSRFATAILHLVVGSVIVGVASKLGRSAAVQVADRRLPR